MLVVAVCGVIPSATERFVLWEIPYARALHYETIYWITKGVEMRSLSDDRRKEARALELVRSMKP